MCVNDPTAPSSKHEGDGAQRRSALWRSLSFLLGGGGQQAALAPITPGQYYLVSVPAVVAGGARAVVSGEWHPFSVAVGAEQPQSEGEGEEECMAPPVLFVVKDCGAWVAE